MDKGGVGRDIWTTLRVDHMTLLPPPLTTGAVPTA